MNYLINFINNLGGALIAQINSIFNTSSSTLPSCTYSSASATLSNGIEKLENGDSLYGTALTSTATAVSNAGINTVYNESIQNLELTQAYVESMNDEELNALITRLETIENNNIEIT